MGAGTHRQDGPPGSVIIIMKSPPMNPASTLRAELVPVHPDFCPLSDLGDIRYELRYASDNNFAGRLLYRDMDCAWLRKEAAEGLLAAAASLRAQRSPWRLLVLDALRPHRVQQAIWQDVAGTPAAMYFADPARGSIHSFGMAVDVTLVDEQGREADMGSGFDEMSPLSHPVLHERHLAEGRLNTAQVQRRELLAQVMAAGGFRGIDTEWWHFDHGDRDEVRRCFPRID